MSLLLLFKGDVPQHWRSLKADGLEVRGLGEGLPPLEGRFVVVVGDRELAERLGVAYMDEAEAEDFYRFLIQRLSSSS
ncbi:hypothetical protein [Pyrobaculum neutrophilum]|uniref:Uncharacterized protein n=1 Tax=Pyrobaculum neutrophilum (strain DSM 2338 / JCM 9278 / NBRC 100436 / V24Sta) TaxID=444157 RepID=B1YDK9_PYRNV|nr:hypothetical protein [Pyrobaculum neutrophilum]ACB39872.1 conserved hypothetical protein [Pyrobaculum neutrophilum V24Sta]